MEMPVVVLCKCPDNERSRNTSPMWLCSNIMEVIMDNNLFEILVSVEKLSIEDLRKVCAWAEFVLQKKTDFAKNDNISP